MLILVEIDIALGDSNSNEPFSVYKPAKVSIGHPHPDEMVQSLYYKSKSIYILDLYHLLNHQTLI